MIREAATTERGPNVFFILLGKIRQNLSDLNGRPARKVKRKMPESRAYRPLRIRYDDDDEGLDELPYRLDPKPRKLDEPELELP